MAGWVIATLKVTNPDGFAEYRELVPQTITDHGGEYVVADVNSTAVEGECPHLSVVLKFPSLEACKAWYNSPEYQAILALRTDNSEGNLAFAEY